MSHAYMNFCHPTTKLHNGVHGIRSRSGGPLTVDRAGQTMSVENLKCLLQFSATLGNNGSGVFAQQCSDTEERFAYQRASEFYERKGGNHKISRRQSLQPTLPVSLDSTALIWMASIGLCSRLIANLRIRNTVCKLLSYFLIDGPTSGHNSFY